MTQYEYRRVRDTGDSDWDDLEKTCTELGRGGWRVVAISEGDRFRCATLERELPSAKVPKEMK